MRLVVISAWWPEPADNGSRTRIAHLLRSLANQHEVHFAALSQEVVAPRQQQALEAYCASVLHVSEQRWRPKRRDLAGSLLSGRPASVRATYNQPFARAVAELGAKVRPDAVVVMQLSAAPYAAAIPYAPRILEEVEVTRLHEAYHNASGLQRLRSWLTWHKHRQYVQSLLRQFDACTVVSSLERQQIVRLVPRAMPVVVLPNGADTSREPDADQPEANTLIYPGSLSFDANLDAMHYFLGNVFPLIRAAEPAVRLRITGRAEPEQRAALSADGVEWTGYVPDVRPLVARSWGEIVPLRLGGGTRLKVLEALAVGTPVISTSKGIEGLDLQPDRDVLVADDATTFASQTLRLLRQPQLRARLSAAGNRVVRQRYDWQAIGRQLNAVIGETVHNRRTRPVL